MLFKITTTDAPASAISFAIWAPIPFDAPVIIATFPLSDLILIYPSLLQGTPGVRILPTSALITFELIAISPLAVFLASDDSHWLTGELIKATGGMR